MDKVKRLLNTFCLASGAHVLIGTNPAQFGLQRQEGIGIGARCRVELGCKRGRHKILKGTEIAIKAQGGIGLASKEVFRPMVK